MKNIEIPLKTCKGCKVEGNPCLVIECGRDGLRYYYIVCDKCTEEIRLFLTKEEALDEYRKRPIF